MQEPKQRIETQIHRRRKAKALSALEVEWDMSDAAPPTQLRKSPSKSKLAPQKEK